MILSGSAIPPSLRGKVDNRSAELVDLIPTIAHVARFQAPAGLPGSDLLSAPVKPGAFSEFHDGGAPAYMWRKTDWKLIVFLNRALSQGFRALDEIGGELYDLRNDPHEFINLYKDPSQAGIREAMKSELLMRLAGVWETYPSGRG